MAAARIYETRRAARRSRLTAVVLWSALSMLPDADVVGFSFGVRYADEWGHRGATHSLGFSFALGAAIGLAAPHFRLPTIRTGAAAALVLTSHALLDTLTNGGLGCALLWPFDLTRYFAPWNPIPVAPIGLYFFSPYGLMVAVVELLLFAPLLWFGLSSSKVAVARPRAGRTTVRALLVSVWIISVWLLTSRDPVRERVIGLMLHDRTEFTRGFSEEALRTVQNGHTQRDVRDRLGMPFYEFLVYPDLPDVCVAVRIDEDSVMWARPPDVCKQRGIEPAVSRAAVLQALGAPAETCWLYSRSREGWYFRARGVCFANDRVTSIVRFWFRD